MKQNLVIFGDSAFAEVAHEYFERESDYRVVGFTVSQDSLTRTELFGKPVVPFERVTEFYPCESHHCFVALVYRRQNDARRHFVRAAKALGYVLATFVSPRAHVWPGTRLGENCFLFESNVVQPFVTIGDNTILWSGNHIGHHSTIGHHNFFASHVVVSGFCNIGDHNFFGVNATIANNLSVGNRCIVGAGALITRSLPDRAVVKGTANFPEPRTSDDVSL